MHDLDFGSSVRYTRKQETKWTWGWVLCPWQRALTTVPAALVSELWNEKARLEPLPQLSCPRALPLHASKGSPGPGQLIPACYVDSWFLRPADISKTNEMEASAKQAWGQQGWWLISKSSGAWHPLCFLFPGPAGLISTAGQWRDIQVPGPAWLLLIPAKLGAAAPDLSQHWITFKAPPRVG